MSFKQTEYAPPRYLQRGHTYTTHKNFWTRLNKISFKKSTKSTSGRGSKFDLETFFKKLSISCNIISLVCRMTLMFLLA
eukprot:UN02690